MSAPDPLHQRFVALCETPSPTGSERAVAELVRADLEALGLPVDEDSAAAKTGCDSGNLICRIEGSASKSVLLCAHLDTVPEAGKIEVELLDGVYRSRGTTILGADNKAAVAVLVEVARRFGGSRPPVGVELVFTVGEEDGLRGAKALDREALRSELGFVFDHAAPIGDVVIAAPTYHRVTADFLGREAHAGVCPEEGRGAVQAAALAVGEMELGRLDEETTANVGVIAGGTAANVVPGRCRIDAEARSLGEARAGAVATAMVEACNWGAGRAECDVDVEVSTYFRGYRLKTAERPVAIATAALGRAGFSATAVTSGGGSDANAFNATGLSCVNLGNGTFANHTPEENVPAANLDSMVRVVEAIVAEAAAC